MPVEIKPLEELKAQALKQITEEEWNKQFKAVKETYHNNIADQVVARIITSALDVKEAPQIQEVVLKSLNGVKAETSITIPLWVFNRRAIPFKKEPDRVRVFYTGVDIDYKTIRITDWEHKSDFKEGDKVLIKDGWTKISGYSEELEINISDRGNIQRAQGAFKQPMPIEVDKVNHDTSGYYVCVEGIATPGSTKISSQAKVVRFNLIGNTREVGVVIYADVIDKCIKEGKITVDVENLDKCRLRVSGVYVEMQKRPRPGKSPYVETDFINAWSVEVLEEIQYPTFGQNTLAKEKKQPKKEAPQESHLDQKDRIMKLVSVITGLCKNYDTAKLSEIKKGLGQSFHETLEDDLQEAMNIGMIYEPKIGEYKNA